MMRRWFTRWLWLNWAVIVLLVLLTHLCGQRCWLVGLLVYTPPQMWLVFLAVIALAAWRMNRRLALLCIGTAVVFAGPLWEWRTHRPAISKDLWRDTKALRVLTVNRGDHHGHSSAPFVMQQQPDLLAIQDSITPYAYIPGAPEYAALANQSRVSEFLLLSRYPITKAQLLKTQLSADPRRPAYQFKGARFEIDFNGTPVAVYNVHMPSPRRDMHQLAHSPSLETLAALRRYWRDHQTMIEDFCARIDAETMPVVVLGDWNQPPIGPNYRRLIHKLQDSHTQAGLGYGWSFPGDWWTPFTAGNVWLRLDLVLCSHDWLVLNSEVEPESESQHAAVSAVLHLR